MKKIYLFVFILFAITTQVWAGNDPAEDLKNLKRHSPVIRENKPQAPTSIQSMFLFPVKADAINNIRNNTVRNAAIGAGMLGAILSGRFAARYLLAPNLTLFGGINLGGKSCNIGLKF